VDEVRDVCTVVAAYGLPGALLDLPHEALESPRMKHLADAALAHRVDGLLAAAVADGVLPATEAQRLAIMQTHADSMSGCLRLEAALLEVLGIFEEAGMQVAVLRGVAAAHLEYPNPSLRSFGDIDLLVPPGLVERAVPLLKAAGFTPDSSPVAAGRWDPTGLAFVADDQLEIDLYDHVIGGPLASTIPATELWRDLSVFELAGTPISALSPEARLISACLRASVGPPSRLIALRDVVQLVLGGLVDVSRVHHLAQEWGVRAFLAGAIEQAWQAFALADVVALSKWAQRYRPTPDELKLLEGYRQPPLEPQGRSRLPRRLLRVRSIQMGRSNGRGRSTD
jgi:hypothetical protein